MPEERRRARGAGREAGRPPHNEMDEYADENVGKKEREIYSVPIRKDGETFVKVEKKE